MTLASFTLDVEINRDPCSCGAAPTAAIVPVRVTAEASQQLQSESESGRLLCAMEIDAILAEREIMRRLACKRCEL